MEMRREERESAGLQEGPAQVPRIERHTCGPHLYSIHVEMKMWAPNCLCPFSFHLASLVEVGIEPDCVVASGEQLHPEDN